MKYKLEKLHKPIWRSGKRVFKWRIINIENKEIVFLFQDEKTGKETLEKLGN